MNRFIGIPACIYMFEKDTLYLHVASLITCTVASKFFLYTLSPLETTVIRVNKVDGLYCIILYGFNINFTLCTMTLLNVLIQHIK